MSKRSKAIARQSTFVPFHVKLQGCHPIEQTQVHTDLPCNERRGVLLHLVGGCLRLVQVCRRDAACQARMWSRAGRISTHHWSAALLYGLISSGCDRLGCVSECRQLLTRRSRGCQASSCYSPSRSSQHRFTWLACHISRYSTTHIYIHDNHVQQAAEANTATALPGSPGGQPACACGVLYARVV